MKRYRNSKIGLFIAVVMMLIVLQPFSVLAEENVENGNMKSESMDETGVESQEMLKENSFRYYEGEWMEQGMVRALSDEEEEKTNPNAWMKIDGVCYNDKGEPVEGAVAKAIDVSEHNGKIDWKKVQASDVDFVILRVGYGNDKEHQDDKYWEYNVKECTRLGIPFGVYIYSYAKNTVEAESEADHVLRLIEGYELSYPVYYDIEDVSILRLGSEQLKNNAITFCTKIANAGYEVGVYSNLNGWNRYLTDEVYDGWHRWVAQYNSQCDYKKEYEMWQCTSKGSVDGINGNVDINFYYGEQKEPKPYVSYRTHVQNIGWTGWSQDESISGSIGQGLRMEALDIALSKGAYDGGISYRAHVQNIGWQSYRENGQTAGTSGQSLRVEAVQIKLTGEIADYYDVYYRVHVQNFGWLGWAKNDEVAGTANYAYRMEAIQIKLVKKGEEAPGPTGNSSRINHTQAAYSAHVQNIGWQKTRYNGETAGTSGQSLRLEGMKISLYQPVYSGGIAYSTHVQNIGWQSEVYDGAVSGTTGQSLRLEAVRICLTGEMAEHYDVYYRVHIQNEGWMDWTKNGEPAGSEGYAYRMEALEIRIVPKGDTSIQTGTHAFISK